MEFPMYPNAYTAEDCMNDHLLVMKALRELAGLKGTTPPDDTRNREDDPYYVFDAAINLYCAAVRSVRCEPKP